MDTLNNSLGHPIQLTLPYQTENVYITYSYPRIVFHGQSYTVSWIDSTFIMITLDTLIFANRVDGLCTNFNNDYRTGFFHTSIFVTKKWDKSAKSSLQGRRNRPLRSNYFNSGLAKSHRNEIICRKLALPRKSGWVFGTGTHSPPGINGSKRPIGGHCKHVQSVIHI